MSEIIFSCDIFLLQNKIVEELPANKILGPRQAVLVGRFIKFVALVYIKWWVRCPLIAERGIVDLEMQEDIRIYPDETVATAAENAIK